MLFVLVPVQVLGYVLVKALVCVPVEQHFQPVNFAQGSFENCLKQNELREPGKPLSGSIM